MKRNFLIVFLFIFVAHFSYGQVYTGISLSGEYPLGYFNSQVEYGVGLVLRTGYLSDNLDLSIEYNSSKYITVQPKFNIGSGVATLCYTFQNPKSYSFLGVKNGVFRIKSEYPYLIIGNSVETATKNEVVYGLAPTAGFALPAGLKNLDFRIAFSYYTLFCQEKYTFLEITFGVNYNINR